MPQPSADPGKIATVGSPSSNHEITLGVTESAFTRPLVGSVVSVSNPMGEGTELALGTVTEVTTVNRWHEDPTFQGLARSTGEIVGMSGDDGDIRQARIRVQAAFVQDAPGCPWKASGPALRMSPATGTPVRMLDQPLVDALVQAEHDIAYMGHLAGAADIPLPMSIPDFASSLGALHFGVYGRSGSGKALDISTPIPTPSGWTTMGELRAGDTVLDEHGTACQVVAAHPVMHDRPCYEVEFSDGTVIVADAEHLWAVQDGTTRLAAASTLPEPLVHSLRDRATACDPLDVVSAAGVHAEFGIHPASPAFQAAVESVGVAVTVHAGSAHASTDVDFYPRAALCRALADGPSPGLRILETRQIARTLVSEHDGMTNYLVPATLPLDLPVRALPVAPRALGAWLAGLPDGTASPNGQRRIPPEYLRASAQQRRTLLDGLTGGSGSIVEVPAGEPGLVDDVLELAASLGYVARAFDRAEHGGPGSGWLVSWAGPQAPARWITRVSKVDSRPVRCITVDSPNALYLAGKAMIPTHNTAMTAYLLATQLRHEDLGVIIVDPQGQWSSAQDLPFSIQGFASELGRDVVVRRISSDLRLGQDAELLASLLQQTSLVRELGLKHEGTESIAWLEIKKALAARRDWPSDDSAELLRALLEYLASDGAANRVYTTADNAARFQSRVNGVLDSEEFFRAALDQFAPIHNLFQDRNPSGGERYSLKATLLDAFTREAGKPAPMVVLDMSSRPLPGMDDEAAEESERAYEILERDGVKAAILRSLFRTLKRASEDRFRVGQNLNTLIVLDEAWRYAAPVGRIDDEETAQLSKDLAGYARDTRKFGIGWLYISQSTRSVNLDIYDQMSVHAFGHGLNGADVEKMGEIVDDRSALRLYRGMAPPRSTGVYSFMITGPVSPLTANATPVMLNVYTDFQAFRDDNDHWIRPIRQRLGLPVVTGVPKTDAPRPGKMKARGRATEPRKAIVESSRAARENRQAAGIADTDGFGDPFAGLEDALP